VLIDAQQQTLVTDGVPPQGRQLGMVGVRDPDLYVTKEERTVIQVSGRAIFIDLNQLFAVLIWLFSLV